MHGDRRVYSVPRFQPGIDPFIGHPSHNGKMPVYRASSICSQIHRDIAISMAQGQRSQTRHANATHTMPIAARTRENPRAKSGAPAARSGPRASPGQKLPEPTSCGPSPRENRENHREPQTHHATRATTPTREPPPARQARIHRPSAVC